MLQRFRLIRHCGRESCALRSVYTTHRPGNFKETILYEDNHLLVVSKPPTLLTQGDSTGDTNLVDEARSYLETHKPGRAYVGLVHRLDRPCSGVVALAKTSKAAARLSESFRSRTVKKHYVCVVNGHVSESHGLVCDHLMKSTKDGQQSVEARLQYDVRLRLTRLSGKNRNQSLLHVRLETGRKHQIRAQLAAMGHPLVGDRKYMAPQGFSERDIALHAAVLIFPHPVKSVVCNGSDDSCSGGDTRRNVVCVATVPPHWEQRYGPEVVRDIEELCAELTNEESSCHPTKK